MALFGVSAARLHNGEQVFLSRGWGALVLLSARFVPQVPVAAEGGDKEGWPRGAGRRLAAHCPGVITLTTLGILCSLECVSHSQTSLGGGQRRMASSLPRGA